MDALTIVARLARQALDQERGALVRIDRAIGDAYDAEKQLTKALPKLAKTASSPDLRTAFETHLEETRGQIDRLVGGTAELDEPDWL